MQNVMQALYLTRNARGLPASARRYTERTTIITQDGRKQNGSLLYTLLPIQISIQQFYEQKLAKLDAECEQERIRKRLEAFQQAQQKNACPPA